MQTNGVEIANNPENAIDAQARQDPRDKRTPMLYQEMQTDGFEDYQQLNQMAFHS